MERTIDVYKHLLFRIAGESFSLLDENEKIYGKLTTDITALTSLEKQRDALKSEICDLTFTLIKAIQDERDRKLLINFKRDFFNGRNISQVKLNATLALFTSELAEKYEVYNSLRNKISAIIDDINANHVLAYQKDLNLINIVCNKENINNGLLLSSELLLKFSRAFAKENKSIDEGTILGLWKYVTRTIAKTTPFSTFTQLNIGTLANDPVGVIEINEITPNIKSYVRYNNYILELILLLIKIHPLLFKFLGIIVNPTLNETETDLIFFTNNNNNESFQIIKSNGIIKYIINKIRQEKEITVDSLVKDLLPLLDEKNTESDVEKYVFELTQTGLLSVNINLSGLDSEWDKSVNLFFQKYLGKEQIGSEITHILDQLKDNRNEYSIQKCSERELTIDKMNKLFNDLFLLLQQETSENNDEQEQQQTNRYNYNFIKLDANNLQNVFLHKLPSKSNSVKFKNNIYEDTSKDIDIKVDEHKIYDFIDRMDFLINTFSFICKTNSDKLSHFDFYEKNFKDKGEISLLSFYECLYKDKATTANSQNNNQNNGGQPNNDLAIYDRIKKLITAELKTGRVVFHNNECNFNRAFLNKLRAEFRGQLAKKKNVSYAAFIQFYINTDNNAKDVLCGVLNGGIMPGRGKMISRFLHLFDEKVTEDLKKWNIANMPNAELFVENSDASFFNANLHPCLMPYEIEMPGGNNRSYENLINIFDIKIRPNTNNKELDLYYKDGKKVIIYDLGFQNLMMRSHLYRLLCSFGNNYGYPHYTINGLFNGVFINHIEVEGFDVKITVGPRITYDNCIILQRKQWTIPAQIIADTIKKILANDASQVYIAIQKWRRNLSIPDEVFVRLYHNTQNSNNPSNQNNNQVINKDDYKPQYINFLSPLAIKLFIKLVGKIKNGNIVIEEMLPDSKQLFKIGDNKFATEALVQWQ